jgi:preprotein translocase subunit SecE
MSKKRQKKDKVTPIEQAEEIIEEKDKAPIESDDSEKDLENKAKVSEIKSEEDDDEPSDARQGPMPQPPKKKKKDDGKAKNYTEEVIKETKRVTWPGRDEVLKWSLIVLAAIAFFTLFTFLVDNFIANPIVYGISGFASGEGFGRKAIALTVAFFVSGLGTAIGVMLHSGGDQNGLSEGLSANLTGGSAVAEKNLDRITIVLALLFTATIICMMIWFPIGTIAATA